MQRFITVERLEALAQKALLNGGDVEYWPESGRPRRVVHWKLCMDCTDPKSVELYARYSSVHGKRVLPLTVVLYVRCRKCDWCKAMRSRFWTGRAYAEYAKAQCTYFGTLTASPDNHYRLDCLARARHEMRGVKFDDLDAREKFEARTVEFGAEATLWLKRLRKAGKRFRYLIIAESHDGPKTAPEMRGRPHFHVLIHEQISGAAIEHENVSRNGVVKDDALIRRQWALGFSRFERAYDPRAAVYLCKYITKSNMARVRASLDYGNLPMLPKQALWETIDKRAEQSVKELDPPVT